MQRNKIDSLNEFDSYAKNRFYMMASRNQLNLHANKFRKLIFSTSAKFIFHI